MSIVRVLGFRLARLSRFLLIAHQPTAARGMNRLDNEIIRLLRPGQGYYVELGANDGVAQSNTLVLELFHGWTGLLIEPVPKIFRRLTKNRSRRRNRLVEAACVSSSHDGGEVLLAAAGLMSTPVGLESDIPDPIRHARSGVKFLRETNEISFVQASAMTLTQVLEMAGSPKVISLLSLDVEGAELEVLKGIDFNQYCFELIVVESRDVNRLEDFFSSKGYILSHHLPPLDFFFVPRS